LKNASPTSISKTRCPKGSGRKSAKGLTLAKDRTEIAHIKQKAVDTATITVKYESGDVGNFTVAWGLPPTVNPPNYPDRIFGARGYAEVEFQMAHQSLRVIDESGTAKTVSACDEDMYHREIANFARSILHDKPLITSGREGKAALAVSLATLESIRTGKRMKL
jgi:predicted dehydrogenase